MTTPFAVHPSDKKRASSAVKLAKEAGISKAEFIDAAREYLKSAKGWPTDIEEQLDLVEKFVGKKL